MQQFKDKASSQLPLPISVSPSFQSPHLHSNQILSPIYLEVISESATPPINLWFETRIAETDVGKRLEQPLIDVLSKKINQRQKIIINNQRKITSEYLPTSSFSFSLSNASIIALTISTSQSANPSSAARYGLIPRPLLTASTLDFCRTVETSNAKLAAAVRTNPSECNKLGTNTSAVIFSRILLLDSNWCDRAVWEKALHSIRTTVRT